MTDVHSEEKKLDAIDAEEKPATEEKKPETEENGVGDESDGESSEEELGLLERPVEILDRKRDRKTTDRLSLEKYTQPKTPKEELDFTQGKGTKLGDIPYIKHQIDKTNAEELKTMHRLLFFKTVKVTMVKKGIRKFCGYPFEKDSTQYKKVDGSLDKIVMPHLKFICGVLGLEKTGDKIAVKERLLEFWLNPTDSGKPIPGKKAKADKKPKSKKKSKSKTPKKDIKSSEEVDDAGSDDESDNESEGEEEKKEEDKEEKEAKKKKTAPAKKKTPKKESPKKKKTQKQPAIKLPVPKKKNATPKKRKADDDSDDDEPLVKKAKGEPSDAEIKKVISTILQDADLEQITMKTVVKQVYDKYPDFDLTPRKDFIKNTVKEIIS